MRRIADTNILVRYLTRDDEKAADKAAEIIRGGVEILPETVPELVYVLTSRSLYGMPRTVVAESVEALLDEVTVHRKDVIKHALKIYQDTRLDFVDCLLIAEGTASDTEVYSFDRKLLNELKRRIVFDSFGVVKKL